MKKILFTGGGSAGHVVPNLAIIEELLSKGDADVCYIGTDGIEKDLVSKWKIPYYTIACPKLLRGGGLQGFCKNAKIPFAFIRAYRQAKTALKQIRPNVVFSKGGYVALPVVYAARALKIPCFAHESDLSVGLSNKLSSFVCETVFTSFPETAKRVKNGVHSGAPLRNNLFAYSREEARKIVGIPSHARVLLVFGGGSGSKRINDALRAALPQLTKRYFVFHVCGKGNLEKIDTQNYKQTEFVTDMGIAYACADVVVSRSGAGTLFELLALKKPALLIPLEGATRGDQKENAEYFRKKGLCHVLPQSNLSLLSTAIERTDADETLRENLKNCSIHPANATIVRALNEACKKR